MEVSVDVAIVGYGPGGAVLASLLAQRGHQVAVLEKFPGPYNLPRMSTLDGEVARILQHAADPADALREAVPQAGLTLYGTDGEIALRNHWDRTICGHPAVLSLHQPNIEAAMHARVDSCQNAQVNWDTAATAIEDLGDGVIVTARKAGAGGNAPEDLRIRARYVIGMDGGSSFVRQAAGISMEVLRKHDDEWLLTDFDIVDPAVPTPPMEIHMQPPHPFYWGPNGDRRCRTDMRLAPGDADDVRTHEFAYSFLEDRAGISRESVRITRQVVYRFRSEIAERMRAGHVFLGGDAAHLMTPSMAQGSCSAMRDAINLAWRLDLVLKGSADASVLDSYEAERLPHVASLVLGSLLIWSRTAETDPGKAEARDAMLRSGEAPAPVIPTITTGFLQTGADEAPVALAGTLSPQGRVRISGQEGLLDDLVGFGFQLVSRIPVASRLTPAQRGLLQRLGVNVVIVGDDPGEVQDLDGTYQDYLEQHRLTAYLSRPDFYIFGTASAPEEISALVDALALAVEPTAEPAGSHRGAGTAPGREQPGGQNMRHPGADFVHGTVQAGEFGLDYAEAGPCTAPATIVSLPGSAGLEMSTAKDRLAGRYRIIELNPPGWGLRADVSRPLPQSEIGVLLADAAASLVGEAPFILVGTSMGGTNALYLAAHQPDRVLGIVLEGSMAPCRPEDLWPNPVNGLPPAHPRKPWATPAFRARQMANRMKMRNWTPRDMDAASAVAVVRERGIPVLALLGTDDELIKPSQEEHIRALLPHADFQFVPGWHDLQNTAPDEFVALVEAFATGCIDRQPGGRPRRPASTSDVAAFRAG